MRLFDLLSLAQNDKEYVISHILYMLNGKNSSDFKTF